MTRAEILAALGDGTVNSSGFLRGDGTWASADTAMATAGIPLAKIQNVSATDKVLGRMTTGTGIIEEIPCTAFGRNLIDDTSLAAQRATLQVDWREGVTIKTPGASENFTILFTPVAITVTQLTCVLTGSATPSITWKVQKGTDRSSGTALITAGNTTTSVTTGTVITSFNVATVAANSYLWFTSSAASGTITSVHISVQYTKD